jgi:CRP-like cAMP-binding protein
MGSALPGRSSFLESLTQGDQEALLAAGHQRRWSRGDVLVRAGDPALSAIVLRAGLVKIHKASARGEEVVLSRLRLVVLDLRGLRSHAPQL